MAQHTLEWQDTFPESCRGGVVAIGNYDGVHRGHAALIAELRRQARDLPGPAVALTFDPHPLELLRPGQSQPLLTTTADRVRLLHDLGADHVIILRTTPSLLGLSASDFFDRVLRERLASRAVVEGVNFGFGRKREGNVETLARLCAKAFLEERLRRERGIGGRAWGGGRRRGLVRRGGSGERGEEQSEAEGGGAS